jgi:hypothetical protein
LSSIYKSLLSPSLTYKKHAEANPVKSTLTGIKIVLY